MQGIEHLMETILLLWSSTGVQGQSTPRMVFPHQSGQTWCSVC